MSRSTVLSMCLQAKAKKSDSRGGTPSSADEAPISNRPRANSYSGENASIISNAPTTASSQYNGAADTRHSADVFQPMESDTLKLNLDKVLFAMEGKTDQILSFNHVFGG